MSESEADKIRLFFAVQKKEMALNLLRKIKKLFKNAAENANECSAEYERIKREQK